MLRSVEVAAWSAGVFLLLVAPLHGPSEAEVEYSAPPFQVADWYRVLVRDNVLGLTAEGVVVVTANDDGQVELGYSQESLHPLLLNYDLFPARINASALIYEMDEESFEPVRFLERGGTWLTSLDGVQVTASVMDVSAGEAWISYRRGDGVPVAEGRYDIEAQWFRWFSRDHEGRQYRVTAELIDHGSGYACAAFRPTGSQVIDLTHYGSVGTGPQTQTFEVPLDATHISLAIMASAGRAPVRQHFMAPDGAVYQASALPGDSPQSLLFVKTNPAGQWTILSEAVEGRLVTSARHFTSLPVNLGPPGPGGDCYLSRATPHSVQGTAPATDALGDSWTLRALAISALGAIRWRGRLFWGAAALFSRLDGASAADQPIRRRILELLETHDSLQTNEIRQELGVGWGTVVHHLSVLQRHGMVARTHLKGRVYWSRPGKAVTARPGQTAARLLSEVQRAPGIGPSHLAEVLGLRHSTVIYHAQRLAETGELRIEGDARRRKYFATQSSLDLDSSRGS